MTYNIKFEKSINALPAILTPNTIYFVKEASGTFIYITDISGTVATKTSAVFTKQNEIQTVACSAEKTNLSVENSVVTFRVFGTRTLSSVRASLYEASIGASVVVDIKKNNVSVLTQKITIQPNQKSSLYGTPQPTISSNNFNDDDEISIDVISVGSTNAGKGLKVYLNWSFS